ncbi:hypothetical protein AAF712_009199 [Marasmius tenuissimus]|uniref:F-box domain-containing protein n=1 Tax=Marasmius tenuissimus TaxID=585030 RepID=A0ABR2ZR24_9AGAR
MITKSQFDLIADLVIPDPCELPEFDVWTHLRSLQPIAVSDPSKLCTFLHEASLELSKYDQFICALEGRVLEAKLKRDSLQRHASQVSSLLSPIRRIPSEILVRLFELAANSDPLGGNLLGTNSEWKSQALRISSVCYRWRTIALDTPQLWARFALDLQPRAQQPLDLFLSRSRERKLSITITQIDHYYSPTPTLLRSLIAHTSRWSFIDHHYLYDDVAASLQEIQEFPSLEYIVCPARGLDAAVFFSKQLQQCSSLKTVVLRYDRYNKFNIASLPLDNTDCLVFQYGPKGSFNDSLRVLKSCADVIGELVYQSVPEEENHGSLVREARHTSLDNDLQEQIECKYVRKLVVNLFHRHGIYAHLRDTFQSLTLPSLVDLQLIGDCSTDGFFEESWPSRFFDKFIVRSECTLTSLRLDLPLLDEDVIACLRHFPSLESLSVTELSTNEENDLEPDDLVQTVTKSLMAKLTVVGANHLKIPDKTAPLLFLPKLISLRLLVHAHFDADVEFVEMVKSRWYSFTSGSIDPSFLMHYHRLRSTVLDIQSRDAEKLVYEPLKICDSEGMRIVVKVNGAYIV